MTQEISWTSSLRTKFGAMALGLLLLLGALIAVNLYDAGRFVSEMKSVVTIAKHRTAHPMLYQLERLEGSETREFDLAKRELRRLAAETEWVLEILAKGDPAQQLEPEQDPRLVASLRERQRLWREEIEPSLERVLATTPGDPILVERLPLQASLEEYAKQVDAAVDIRDKLASDHVKQIQLSQWFFAGVLLVMLLIGFWALNRVVRRTTTLASVAAEISEGNLNRKAPIEGRDELAYLGTAFNEMTGNLRAKIESEKKDRERLQHALNAISETTSRLAAASSEILAGTTQQAAGMREQAAAVAETVTTVDEVLQTAEQAAERANAVYESAQRAVDVSSAGREAVDDTMALMKKVQEQSSDMAKGITRLAEHGQEIGEIIAAVTDIADQTNLLAVNASIEASRAGEHGKGFTVVAGEIKELADQSKTATRQVRQILGEIQKSTNKAVLATEESTRSIERAIQSVEESGETIGSLEETITEASRTAAQIAASSAQQATGMGQIQQAMAHINEASGQNLAATRQTEQAAHDLNELGVNLKELLADHER